METSLSERVSLWFWLSQVVFFLYTQFLNMCDKIKKLNNLKRPESFIQINTVKGFKYIDRAGEIVNLYHKKNGPPDFRMGLEGLDITKPKDKIAVLKITPQILWMKFTEVDSLDMVSNLFSTEAKEILSILDIEKIARIGWRTYFIYEFSNPSDQTKCFKKLTNLDDGQVEFVKLAIETQKKFKLMLRVQPVVKTEDQNTHSILFDVDIFESGEFTEGRIDSKLKEFNNYLKNENFLATLNKIVS